jgi:4-hydroxybenzoyl-CoA reductase subunit beta
MLPLPPFRYERPDSLDQLLALNEAPGTRIVAGGTDLLPSMKHRIFSPDTLISLRRVRELHTIHEEGTGLSIGAACTLSQVRRDPRVRERLPALAEACATVATTTIQAMGTLGGNLMLDTRCLYYNQPQGWRASIGGCLKCEGNICHVARTGTGCYAAHSADTVPVLWLAGAVVELATPGGRRKIPLRELYDGEDGRAWLRTRKGEVLTRVIIPPGKYEILHRKVRARGALDYGLLLAAVRKDGDGARAVISAIGPAPLEFHAELAADLPELARKATQPLNTHAWSTTWRKHMVGLTITRALAELQGGEG